MDLAIEPSIYSNYTFYQIAEYRDGSQYAEAAADCYFYNVDYDRVQRNATLSRSLVQLVNLLELTRESSKQTPLIPDASTVANASVLLRGLFSMVADDGWVAPLITPDGEGDVMLEWINNEKRLALYVGPSGSSYLKIWGANVRDEMEDGPINGSSILPELWNWLYA